VETAAIIIVVFILMFVFLYGSGENNIFRAEWWQAFPGFNVFIISFDKS
jgi:hypothetical protein